MSSVSISLPDSLQAFVERRAEEQAYETRQRLLPRVDFEGPEEAGRGQVGKLLLESSTVASRIEGDA